MSDQEDRKEPEPKRFTPPQRWARALLERSDSLQAPLLRAVVGVTQLHVARQYPDEAFVNAVNHLGDQVYNAVLADQASIHFAVALSQALDQSAGVKVEWRPEAIAAAVQATVTECVAALLNAVREEAAKLPDCSDAGREILAKQQAAATPPQEAASSPSSQLP